MCPSVLLKSWGWVQIMSLQQQQQGQSHSGTNETKLHQGPLREVFQHRHPKNCHALAQASGPCRTEQNFSVGSLQMTQEEKINKQTNQANMSETIGQTVSKASFILISFSFCWKSLYHPIHKNLFLKSLSVYF